MITALDKVFYRVKGFVGRRKDRQCLIISKAETTPR